MTHEFNKPRTEMGLYQQRHCQFELKWGRRWDRMKEGSQTLWILQGGIVGLFSCECELSLKKGRRIPKAIEKSCGLPLPTEAQSSQARGRGEGQVCCSHLDFRCVDRNT